MFLFETGYHDNITRWTSENPTECFFLLNKFLPTEWNTKPNEQHDSIVIYTIKKSIRFVEENTPTARKHKYTHTTHLNGTKKERLFWQGFDWLVKDYISICLHAYDDKYN